MRTLTRTVPFAVLALLIALMAMACKSDGNDSASNAPNSGGDIVATDDTGGEPDKFVSGSPLEVLSASADTFDQGVDSLQADMTMKISAGGFDIDADAMMAYQSPDQLHMTMNITGLGSYEMLMLGTRFYMNVPPQGWVVFSLDDLGLGELGLDASALEEVSGDHSMVDYAGLVKSLGGDVEDLGDETIDGRTYRHYRASLDFADVAESFSDAFGATSSLGLDDMSGPVGFDVWVDVETGLPHRLTISGEFAFGVEKMRLDADITFSKYNEPVEIPLAPAEAVSFAEMFGALFDTQ